MSHNKTVSICMITYNHEQFIAEAIESVLAQKTNFPYELIIGEDFSTDNTRSICIEYAEKYPTRIRLLNSDKNIGAMPNFIRTLKECTGKYIALCDGDDFWNDHLKLQKQVDFLERNTSFVICYHPVHVLHNNKIIKDTFTRDAPEVCDIQHLAHGNIMHTCSVVFRAKLFNKFPESFATSTVGDYFLHMLNARYGLIKKLPELMGSYRIHRGGVWSSEKNMDLKILTYLEAMIGCFQPEINKILIQRHKKIAYKSLLNRINEPKFKNRFKPCLKYEKTMADKILNSMIIFDQKLTNSALLKFFKKIYYLLKKEEENSQYFSQNKKNRTNR